MLIYDIDESPRTLNELLLYALQQLSSVFVATVLIARVCGTPVDSCLVGAGVGTLVYQIITGFKSPMFISSCGATVSAVIGALAIGEGNNYLAVIIGGAVILLIYALFAALLKRYGEKVMTKIFSPLVTGAVTMVIGLNLATFIPTYVQVNGAYSNWGMVVALFSMVVTAIAGHYTKGFLKTIPFLVGLAAGYMLSAILTLSGTCALIDFSVFNINSVFSLPKFAFLQNLSNSTLESKDILTILWLFVPVSLCAMLEHYSDHKVLSEIIGTDLTKTPGLHKTLFGDGVSSFVGTVLCGLPNTSYGESIATTGFSRVASVKVISTAAIGLVLMAFFTPLQALLASIPQPVFGGLSMILYGYITCSGLRMIINSGDKLASPRSLIIVSATLSIGVSGVHLFSNALGGVSLALIAGVVLNAALKTRGNNE